MMLTTVFSVAFFVVGGAVAYWFFIHPLLRTRPKFAEFLAASDSWRAAVLGKLNTIKTKLSAKLLMIASALVGIHDAIATVAVGFDWTPISSLVSPWAWLLIVFSINLLFFWLRTVTAKTQDIEVEAVAAGATIKEAQVIAGKLPEGATHKAEESE